MSRVNEKAIALKPDFINVGPGRCASSWLLEILESHPEIAMAQIKETEFFNTNFERGSSWYLGLFPNSGDGVAGEISNCYYTEPLVAKRIFDFNPSAKLILNLRDPFSLLQSFHGFGIRRGLSLTSVADDLDVPIGRIMGSGYEQRARHDKLNMGDKVSLLESVLLSRHFARFLEVFPREQIYFFVFERLKSESAEVVREIYQFLGVDDKFQPKVIGEIVNQGIVPKSRYLARLATQTAFALRQIGAYRLLDGLKKSRLVKRLLFTPSSQSTDSVNNPRDVLERDVQLLIENDMRNMMDLCPGLGRWWNPLLNPELRGT